MICFHTKTGTVIAPDAASRDEVLRLLVEGHEATVHATGAVAIELERPDIEK